MVVQSKPKSDRDREAILSELLTRLVSRGDLHQRWLNTLSLLENTGARKISAGQDPEFVTESQLRHTVEEARHAWFLKRQIVKVPVDGDDVSHCSTYEPAFLFAARQTRNYLRKLDWFVSAMIKPDTDGDLQKLKHLSYLLVTYAIEMRADVVYRLYGDALEAVDSPVTVRGIVAEEENHLAEMRAELGALFVDVVPPVSTGLESVKAGEPQEQGLTTGVERWMQAACSFEEKIFDDWLEAVIQDCELLESTGT